MQSFTWSVKECFVQQPPPLPQRDFTIRAPNPHIARQKLLEFIQLHNMLYNQYNILTASRDMWHQAECVCAQFQSRSQSQSCCFKCFVRGDMQKQQERVEQLRNTLATIIMHNFVQFNATTPWWVQHGNPPVLNSYTGGVMGLQEYILHQAPVLNV